MIYRVRTIIEWHEGAPPIPTVYTRGVRAVSAKHALNKSLAYAETTAVWQDRVVNGGWRMPRLSVEILS